MVLVVGSSANDIRAAVEDVLLDNRVYSAVVVDGGAKVALVVGKREIFFQELKFRY